MSGCVVGLVYKQSHSERVKLDYRWFSFNGSILSSN